MRLLLIISLLCFASAVNAQQPVFSQYYATGLYLNPALAGMESDMIFQFNYRSQWNDANLPFETFQASYIHPILKRGIRTEHTGGVGVSFFNDQSGINNEFKSTGANLSYAYNFLLNRYGNNIIALGGMIGAYQNKIDFEHLQWSSQYNPTMGYDNSSIPDLSQFNERVFYPVFNFGFMWTYRDKKKYELKDFSIYMGASVANLNQPKLSYFEEAESSLSPLYKIHGGFSIFLTKRFSVSPNYLVQYQQAAFQTNTGAYLGYMISDIYDSRDRPTKVIIGAWYRLHDSFIFNAGLSSKHFNIAFSYDVNTSSLGRYVGGTGAYEISLAVKLIKQQQFRRFSSPLI